MAICERVPVINGLAHHIEEAMRHQTDFTRPTLLVAEPEPEQALSTRKLVLETAKFNVITAHSTREFLALFRRFPSIDGAIVHGMLGERSCQLLAELKKTNPRLITIFL